MDDEAEEPTKVTKTARFTPGHIRGWAKDVIIIGSAVIGIGAWLNGRAENWVQSDAYKRDKAERAERDEREKKDRAERDERLQAGVKALEVRAALGETKTNDTATDVKVIRVELGNSQKTLDRIETILDERKRR